MISERVPPDRGVHELRAIYRRHFADDPRRERGFPSAAGFTTAFAVARAITLAEHV